MWKSSSLRCFCLAGALALSSFMASAEDKFAPLPEAITSFGAVTTGDWLYVFGGHKGERHDYNVEMVSKSFRRLNLTTGKSWEQLPDAAASQGLPLATDGQYIYRVGGMTARNHSTEKQDLYSLTLVQRFDPAKNTWHDLPSLPSPRSSHDAVVVGQKLYVGGGWLLAGGTNKPAWHTNALVLDLADPKAQWQSFAQPFQRRALAVAALGSRLYFMGGMDSNSESTLAVDVFETTTQKWSTGPTLPPGRHKGFSCSAINQAGRIYVTMLQGDLLRLSKDEKSWEVTGRLQNPRLSHRLVTAGKNQLIALGGEGEEKLADLELLTPSAQPLALKDNNKSATDDR